MQVLFLCSGPGSAGSGSGPGSGPAGPDPAGPDPAGPAGLTVVLVYIKYVIMSSVFCLPYI